MATQKEMAVFRAQFIEAVKEIKVDGFEFTGMTVDGPVFTKGEDAVVVKSIAKKETFDLDDALTEYEDKERARLEREAAKAEKLAKVKAKEAEKEAEKED